MQTVKSYETIIFLQGDDYDEFEAAMYPDREGVSLGWPNEKAGLEYLMQWEYGEPTEPLDSAPWGGGDHTHEVDGYVMSWHPGLSYASLTRVTESHDPECEGCEHDCPHARNKGRLSNAWCQTCDDHHEAANDE